MNQNAVDLSSEYCPQNGKFMTYSVAYVECGVGSFRVSFVLQCGTLKPAERGIQIKRAKTVKYEEQVRLRKIQG